MLHVPLVPCMPRSFGTELALDDDQVAQRAAQLESGIRPASNPASPSRA